MRDVDNSTKKVFGLKLKTLFSDGSSFDATPFVVTSRTEINYDNYVMAYYRFIIDIPPEILVKIHSDRDKVVFAYSMIYASEDTEDKLLTNDIHPEIILKPLMDINSPINYINNINASQEQKSQKPIRYEFVAVSEEVLKTNKPVVSGIYRNVTIDEAILNLLSLFNNREIYYMPSDNKRSYDQLLLSPGNVYSNLKYIDDVYGIYNNGVKIFNHSNGINIISYEGAEESKYGSVSVNINFTDTDKPIKNVDTSNYDEISKQYQVSNKIITTNINNVSVSDNAKLSNEILGSDVFYFGYRDSGRYTKQFRDETLEDRNGKFTKATIFEDVYDNDYKIMRDMRRARNARNVKLTLTDVDLTIEDSFKKFKLIFDNDLYDYYDGDYEVVSFNQQYNNNSKGGSLITHILLRKS